MPIIRSKIKNLGRKVIVAATSYPVVYFFGEVIFWLMGRRGRKTESLLEQPKRILVVRLDDIGDVILTVPLLRALRNKFADAFITLIVDPRVYDLIQPCPYVNQVITCDLRVACRLGRFVIIYRVLKTAVRSLWKNKFDIAILPCWDADFYHGALLSYLSGAPVRIAYSECVTAFKQKLNKGHDRLFTHLKKDKEIIHEVKRSAALLDFLGIKPGDYSLELWLKEDDKKFSQGIIDKLGVTKGSLLVGIGLGAGEPKRIWPVERFGELITWLVKEKKAKVVLLGSSVEISCGRNIQKYLSDDTKTRVVDLIGKTSLRQAAALIGCCSFYIGNDTGLIHIAAAMKRPVIQLSCWPVSADKHSYKSTERFGAWQVENIVLNPHDFMPPCIGECSATEAHCILGVSVQQVKAATERLIINKSI